MSDKTEEAKSASTCLDRQEALFVKMVEALDSREEILDLKSKVENNDRRVTAMDNRVMVLEAAHIDNNENSKKILEHLESSPTPEQYSEILGYIEKIKNGKNKAIKYYIIGSMAIMLGGAIGIPYVELLKAIFKMVIKTV